MQPPTGKVTLVFTDIEGSTALWERHREAFKQVLQRHNDVLRQAAASFGGYEVKTEGDAFFLAFSAPAPALDFAMRAQAGLADVCAGSDPVRVRIGIHTGEPLVEVDRHGRADYFGPAVNRAARVASAGHGGQTLLSQATWHAVSERADKSLDVKPLGEVRLRGLEEPEKLYQVQPPGSAREFPPLRGVYESPTNLPSQTSTFLGRGRELRALRALLLGQTPRGTDSIKPLDTLAREPGVPDTQVITRATVRDRGTRLVTLTGPGGCGKTRLAIALGADVLSTFRDGVWFADLAAVTDEAGLCAAIGGALRIDLPPGRGSAAQRLGWALEERELLLVLDTFEHLSAHNALLSLWLRTAPRLKLVVTSRELLRVDGEVEFAVSPLPLPLFEVTDGTGRLPGKISDSPAVQLFLERAAQAKPGFALTPKNAPAIAEIVQRVDGIPLAIELAAARLRGMTPEQLAERLRSGIDLLSTRGSGRQANLNDAIAWSFGLLDAWERTALLQLSVFSGPFTLESAEAVLVLDQPLDTTARNADEPPPETMDLVFSLRDKSLLSLKSEEDRYLLEMLGTIRAFCAPQFEKHAPQELRDSIRLRHAQHFLAHAQSLAELLNSPMGHSLKETDAWGITDTLSAARWALAAGRHELGLALALAASQVLHARSRYPEMQRICNDAHATITALGGPAAVLNVPSLRPLLAPILTMNATATQRMFNLAGAQELATQAADFARQTNDGRHEADALNILGICQFYRRDYVTARASFDAALVIQRRLNDERGIAHALSNIAMTQMHGDFEEMRKVAQEAYSIYARIGDRRGQARAANTLGVAYEWLHDHDRARELYKDSIRLKLQLKDNAGAANSRANLASMDFRSLRFEEALEQFQQVLEPMRQGGDKINLGMTLESLGTICIGLGRPEEALQYLDRCVALRRETKDRAGLQDALSARAGALHALGRTLEAGATCDEMMAAALESGFPQDEMLARMRAAICARPEERAAHRARFEELEASGIQLHDDIPVLARLVRAELATDPAEAALLRKDSLDRARFATKLMDVVYRARRTATGKPLS